jgi:hypothetical protein
MRGGGFWRSLVGALVAVVVLAVTLVGVAVVDVFEHGVDVPGADVLRSSDGAWSAAPEIGPSPEPLPPAYPQPPEDALVVFAFADGTALAVPVTYAKPRHDELRALRRGAAPSVHWYDGRWQRIGELAQPFEVPDAVRLSDGRVVITDVAASFVVDPAQRTLAPAGVPLQGAPGSRLIAAGDRAYAVLETPTFHRVDVLLPDEGAWTSLPNSPSSRRSAEIFGSADGSLVIQGGWMEGRSVRIEGALWMAGLLAVAALTLFLSTRALLRGVRWDGVITGAVLGGLMIVGGWIYLLALSVPHGRPLRFGREVWRGRVRAGAGRRPRAALPWPTRWLLARAWARDAALEHASVAAFEQLARRLEAVGAPVELVARARRAAAEEAEHARLCLALAERYAGRSFALVPAPVPTASWVLCGGEREALLERLAIESFVDGTLGEGWAAAAAAQALTEATDPAVRHALEVIARDEASHAAHARDVVAFCMAEGGERAREAVRRVTARERRRVRHRGLPVLRLTAALARHGRFRERQPGALDAALRARL